MKLVSADAYRKALALPDLTDPANGPHALQLLLNDVIHALVTAWGCPLVVHRGSPLVSVADNYERLLYEPDAAARDARYTRYVTRRRVLRTHTTALIPGLLRSTDPRVASQLRDLEPYRPISPLPPVRRDLSIAVAAGRDVEELGDRVRAALGEEAEAVEAVEILGETPYDELPPQAIERLGIAPGQTNLLVRVTLRRPTRTLTDADANRLRNAIYAAVHEGNVHQWAAS